MKNNQLFTRAACIFLAAVSILVIGIQPVFVGLMAGQFNLSLTQQSIMMSTELCGSVLGTLLYLTVIQKIGLRAVALGLGFLLLAVNMLMVKVHAFDSLLYLRFVSGICSGALYSMTVFCLGRLHGPDRSFGVLLFFQTALFAVMAGALPAVWENMGYTSAVYSLCAWFTCLVVACFAVPKRFVGSEQGMNSPVAGGLAIVGVLSLLGMFLLQIAIYAIWGFVEGIGADAGIAPTDVGWAISIGLLGGLPGAALPGLFGGRVGRAPMIVIGALCVLGAIFMMFSQIRSSTDLMLAVLLLNFGWNLALAYYMAAVAVNDPKGQLGKLVGVVQILAAACAPLVLSVFLQGNEKASIFILSTIAILLSGAIAGAMMLGAKKWLATNTA